MQIAEEVLDLVDDDPTTGTGNNHRSDRSKPLQGVENIGGKLVVPLLRSTHSSTTA